MSDESRREAGERAVKKWAKRGHRGYVLGIVRAIKAGKKSNNKDDKVFGKIGKNGQYLWSHPLSTGVAFDSDFWNGKAKVNIRRLIRSGKVIFVDL
ncbi:MULTISPECIES: hypothetical protein [unclassified Inquilinus]|uniref:hypothetical protein n=1 Tax=unclassified Inquilinus TaxID=2645927 RepID=UPI003F918CEF